MTTRYVVLTPFNKAEVVAGVLKLRGIEADVVATESGACAVHDAPEKTHDDWDISELLGPDSDSEDTPDGGDQIASALSKLSKFGVVLLTSQIGTDVGMEEGASGIVTAVRYLNGQRGDDVAAGLILNTVDPVVERLALGTSLEDIGAPVIRHADVNPGVLGKLFGRGTEGEK